MTSIANYIRYNVHGKLAQPKHRDQNLSGHVVFSDGLTRNAGLLPLPPGDPLGSQQYKYRVVDFSISVGGNQFAGDDGTLYFEWTSPNGMGDTMWWLKGDGDWQNWYGELFFFHHTDGRPYKYDPLRYALDLAPLIHLEAFVYTEPPWVDMTDQRLSLWLNKCCC